LRIILSTVVGTEYATRNKLNELLDGRCWLPVYKTLVRPRHVRRPRESIRPLLPRYAFLLTAPEQFAHDRAIVRERTRAWPLHPRGGEPWLEIPERDIASLKEREAAHEFDFLARGETRTIRVGALVFIISGAMAGRNGKVIGRLKADLYKVELPVLGNITIGSEHLSETPSD
jgi:hypothetical protein